MTIDPGENPFRINQRLFEQPGNQTAEALLQALLVWGIQTELPGTKPGEFPYMVRAFEGLYKDGALQLIPMTDEEVEESDPFMMYHYTDQEDEKTVILVYLHPGIIIETISFSSETEIEVVLKGFAKVVFDVIDRYKLLRGMGARFLYH